MDHSGIFISMKLDKKGIRSSIIEFHFTHSSRFGDQMHRWRQEFSWSREVPQYSLSLRNHSLKSMPPLVSLITSDSQRISNLDLSKEPRLVKSNSV